MYYRLKEKYLLRGWELLPYAIVDTEKHTASFFDRKTFDVLSLCEGNADFSLPLFPQAVKDTVDVLLEKGIIVECSAGEGITEKQKYKKYNNRFMRRAHWSITGCCNAKCRHCYISGAENRYGELSHEDVMKIVDGLGECGVLSCSITGGDPLVRRDFWDIIDGLLKWDIDVSVIYTNGILVNDKLLDGLEERGIHPEFNMSFDGLGHHDWLRGFEGAEKAVKRAFELCQKRGFPTGAEMCLWKDNVHSLRDSVNYLASVGCRSLKVNPVGDTGAWKEGGYQKDHGLSFDETYQVYFDYIDDFYRDQPVISLQLGGFFMGYGKEPDHYSIPVVHTVSDPAKVCVCAHARNTMYISAEGRALTCMPISNNDEFQKDYPLIQEIGVKDCLNDSKYMELVNTRTDKVLAHNEKCSICRYKNLCLGGCRAAGLLCHPGDILAPDEATCKVFTEGWAEKIIKKMEKLRPGSKCVELERLRNMGREGELIDKRW